MNFYYILLFILGVVLSLLGIANDLIRTDLGFSISTISIVGGFGTALLGSTIFYLRKLYKSCINCEMSIPNTDESKIAEIGIFTYFFLRPFFALGFSILIHVITKSSVQFITVKETILNEGFIYLMMLLSFFGGFAAGDVITYIESKSAILIKKFLN